MGLTYLGPARTLQLGDGTVVERGRPITLDDATKAALVKAGHRFRDDATGAVETRGPQLPKARSKTAPVAAPVVVVEEAPPSQPE